MLPAIEGKFGLPEILIFNSTNAACGTILDAQSRRVAKWRFILLLTLLPGWYEPTAAAVGHYESKNVLILYSHEVELSTYAELDRALRSSLQSDLTRLVAFYTEYLDLLRFPEERRQRMLAQSLRMKYSTQQIDLVALVSPLAFNFFSKYGDSLFPGIPAIFTSVGIQRLANVPRKTNVTGVAVMPDVRDTQSAWELNKWYILAAIVLVVLQFWLILTLVLQRLKLKRSEATLKDLSRHLITVQEEERKRIARELHDDFGQRLALLKIDLEILGRDKGQIHNLNENERMEGLLANVTDLANDMQNLSHKLHSSKLQYIGLKGALADLCRQISKQHQIKVDFRVTDLTGPVPDDLALCFYRVAQEALHNAAKHSRAQHVVVQLSGKAGVLLMLITDDGQGFDQHEASLGLGLASMRERLQMIGGKLWLLSRPGRGTELAAEAPLEESSRKFKVS